MPVWHSIYLTYVHLLSLKLLFGASSCLFSAVSLDQLGADVRVMTDTFQMAVGELVKDQDNIQLRDFVIETEEKVNDIKERFQMAEDTYHRVVKFYGEDPKTAQPGQFFNEFSRFIAAYKVNSRLSTSVCIIDYSYCLACCQLPLSCFVFLVFLPFVFSLISVISSSFSHSLDISTYTHFLF